MLKGWTVLPGGIWNAVWARCSVVSSSAYTCFEVFKWRNGHRERHLWCWHIWRIRKVIVADGRGWRWDGKMTACSSPIRRCNHHWSGVLARRACAVLARTPSRATTHVELLGKLHQAPPPLSGGLDKTPSPSRRTLDCWPTDHEAFFLCCLPHDSSKEPFCGTGTSNSKLTDVFYNATLTLELCKALPAGLGVNTIHAEKPCTWFPKQFIAPR